MAEQHATIDQADDQPDRAGRRVGSRAALPARLALAVLLFLPITPAVGAPPPAAEQIKRVLSERATSLEADIAALMQRRADTPSARGPLLESQIDLRIVARWLLTQAAAAPPESDLQVCAALRARGVVAAAELLDEKTEKLPSLSRAQADALRRLHERTYALGALKSVGETDRLCRDIVADLMPVVGPLPGGMKALPPMRPAPSQPVADAPAPAATPRTPAELSRRAGELSVSGPLRRQLVDLAAAAVRSAAESDVAPDDPRKREEAGQLHATLADAVTLAEGLQANTGVEPRERGRLERQLAQGLVLFTDVRTRPAGRARVEALARYREVMNRIRGLQLSPELSKRLSPAFVWARSNVEQGPVVWESVEAYLDLCRRFDARRGREVPPLPANQAKLLASLTDDFTARREAFLDTAEALGDGGGGGALLSTSPADLKGHVEQMRLSLEHADLIERAPAAVAALAAYKPKPFGALEKRVAVSVMALGPLPAGGTPERGPGRDEAAAFLADLVRLADFAAGLERPAGHGARASVVRRYAGQRLVEFDARRRQMVHEQADAAAGGRAIERGQLDRLAQAEALVAALREAGDLEAAAREAEFVSRWVDWGLTGGELAAVLDPYRDATADAFAGFADGRMGLVDQWPAVRRRYEPVIAVVTRVGAYGPQCARLPTGLTGELARLATPLEKQPFATERYAAFVLGAWGKFEPSTDSLAARLGAPR